jgi:uncharacterized protein (UPF0261 family)
MAEKHPPRILLIGAGDTKAEALLFVRDCIVEVGGTRPGPKRPGQ